MPAVHTSYETPTLHEVGSFDELTMCLWDGECVDFLGCGTAWVCI